MKINKVNKITDKKFLNFYTLDMINPKGKEKEYYFASRRSEEELACKTKNHNKCDAVMIIPKTEDGDYYLIKQFRPVINDYIYEFPAGIIDSGETIEEAAIRELYEETGLKATEYSMLLGPCYTSVGMTDESVAVIEAIVTGEATNEHAEDDEEIEIVKIKKSDINNFIKSNIVSIKTALILKLADN